MPAFEVRDLEQDAVLWLAPGGTPADAYGQFTVGNPVQIKVRWLDVQNEALDSKGNLITTDVTVIAAQDIAIGSVLWQGLLENWLGTGSGVQPDGLVEVKTRNVTPSIKNRETRYEFGCLRFRDTLPNFS
jgi:hypothetical protein